MAKNFNFQASLKLNSTGFKKGVNQVKSSLTDLKKHFLSIAGALGAGLGFTQLIASIKNTATELSVAKNTLKNVSYVSKGLAGDVKETTYEISNYAENLAYVKRLSRDYHQDLVTITENFAKFTAACKKTNLSLENQRMVFESLTRAAAFYHLSADSANNMMNAIVQMMSKGKVAAEELRRQLGNTLPGAFNLMAAAMGKSTSQLEAMMKNGELIASEALPKFAAMLNAVTKNIEFDSIQSSMNDLKNSWYDFVETSGAEGHYNNLIKGTTNVLNTVTNNIRGIKSSLDGLFGFIISSSMWNVIHNRTTRYFEKLKEDLTTTKLRLSRYEKGALKNLSGSTERTLHGFATSTATTLTQREISALRSYNALLMQRLEIERNLGLITRKELKQARDEMKHAEGQLIKLNQGLNNTVQTTGKWEIHAKRASAAFERLGNSIGTFLKANWAFLLIGILTTVISYVKRVKDEIREVLNIYKDYETTIKKVVDGHAEDAVLLKTYLKTVKDTNVAISSRLIALDKLNKSMGTNFTLDDLNTEVLATLDGIEGKYDVITTKVYEWIEATKKQALMQAYASQITEMTARKIEAQRKMQEAAEKLTSGGKNNATTPVGMPLGLQMIWKWAFGDLVKESESIKQYDAVIQNAEAELQKLGASLEDFFEVLQGSGNDPILPEIMAEYNSSLTTLKNQLKEGALDAESYEKAFNKLVTSVWEKAAGTGELSIKDILKKVKDGETLSELEKWYYQLSRDAKKSAKKVLLDSAKEFIEKSLFENLDDDIEKAFKEAEDALDKYLDKEAKKLEKELILDLSVLGGDFNVKQRKDRNTLFDYNKTEYEKVSDELEQTNDWLDDIKDSYGKLIEESTELGYKTEIVQKKLDELSEKYRYAAREASTLEAAMNYLKVVEDIKNVKKELNNLVYSGVKDFATSMDRVVSSVETLKETMNDSDASGWEKFMVVFNLLAQVLDSTLSIWQTITTIQELSATLGAAKIAEQTALNDLLKEELALRMAAAGATDKEIAARMEGIASLLAEKGILASILGTKKAEGAQIATNTALKAGEAAASTAAAAASAGEAVAGATASGSKMPFPLNLVAIAAGVAAVVGALSMIGKFANGGIVGGNSKHGDRNIARVNSGEMILNKAQQGTLWGLLNGKGSIGGNVEFKIRGADLVGTINNYSKKISK